MFNDLPDVLIGDVFVEAVLQAAQEPEKSEQLQSLTIPLKEEVKDNFVKQPRNHLSSAQMIASLPGSAQFFALASTSSTSTSSSSSSSQFQLGCDACGLNFKKSSIFIRCAECVDPIIDLCVHCFGNGAEWGSHLRSHAYVTVQAKSSQIFKHSRLVSKLNVFQILRVMEQVEKRGCFNFSELEKFLKLESGDGEKIYLEIVALLSHCREPSIAESCYSGSLPESTTGVEGLSGGMANFNPLRDEFEHEYVPEAETLLAAVTPPVSSASGDLISLFDGYNGILDERERRRKVLKSAKMITLREFFNIVKKRKSDEREMFEKLRIFIRPALAAGPDECMHFLESLASSLTSRKRMIDRVKRLLLLLRNGISSELGEALQFDLDRKKRNDINSRRASTPSGSAVKVWTTLPAVSAPDVSLHSRRGAVPSLQMDRDKNLMNLEEAIRSLPAGTDAPFQLCAELQIAPQHLKVIQIAVHAVMRKRGRDIDDSILFSLVRDGVFGSIRRYLLAAQGLPVAAVAHNPLSQDEMKSKLIQYCRLSYSD